MTEFSGMNVLWICSDQQRWDTLGCLGNPFTQTPHLDRLAAGGTLFEHAYAQSPMCTPSRSSFLTGRYPRTTRCRQNGQDIPADEVLVTRLLADAGYRCGLSGKLHLSACHPEVCTSGERRINDGYTEFNWSHHPSSRDWKGFDDYADWLAVHGQSFSTPDHPRSRYVQQGMPEQWHQSTWCTDRAIDFIRRGAVNGRPWLFSLNPFDPHHAFDPPATYLDRYEAMLDEIPLPDYAEGELDNKPRFQHNDHTGAYGMSGCYPFADMSETDHRLVRAAYWAMCDLLDVQVGRLLKVLEETGQLDNTLVIYMSDHGELLGDHGIYLKGPFFYEPSIRVPLIVSAPGTVRAQRSMALVELTDLAQTVLDAAGLPHAPGMQGRSLWPLLTGKVDPGEHRDDLYTEYYNASPWHRDPAAHLTMVRTATHKLVVNHSDSDGELYDLVRDPCEHHNLWGDPACRSVKEALLLRLCNRMAWTMDPLPHRRSAW